MGVCSSKNKKHDTTPSDQVQQKQQAEQKPASLDAAVMPAASTPAVAVGEPYSTAKSADAELVNDGASSEPATPQPAAAVSDGIETPVHTYNSAEKPHRSAMRTSDTNKSEYSRRSSSGMSNVGFSVIVDAPDAGAAGLSLPTPGKSPRTSGRGVAVTNPTTASSAAAADGDADAGSDGCRTPSSEGHKSFEGANSISLKKILDIFYDKVVAHEQIGHYFVGIDMIKLKRHQLRFMGLAFGGKELVNEEDPNLNLRKIHYHLIRDKGLSLAHWEVFVGLFDETMQQLEKDIPLETREAAMRSIHATKHYFVPIGEENEFTHTNIAAMPVPEEGEELKCPFAGTAAAAELQQRQ